MRQKESDMSNITRRKSWAFLAGAPLAGWLVGKELQGFASPLAPEDHWKKIDPREVIRQRYFPNVVLTTHENKKVRLYDDLVKDKVMLINFMYTSCERLCPRVTQNLVKVQKLLGDRMGHDVFFYSFSLDPKNDKPEVLKDYAAMHKVGPGWSFLTGAADDLEMLRRILGFTDPDPEQDKDRDSHIGNVRYGNEPRQLWGACPGMSHAEFIVEALSWVDWPKGQKPQA
jgi:protein SCO1/2